MSHHHLSTNLKHLNVLQTRKYIFQRERWIKLKLRRCRGLFSLHSESNELVEIYAETIIHFF